MPNVGKWRWQSSSQRWSGPFHSQDWLADVPKLIHSFREICYGIAALSQKRKTIIQVIFTQSSVSMTTTPEYLPVSGFNVPSLHLSQSLQIHPFQASKNKLQQSKQHKSYLTCLRYYTTEKIPVKKHESKLATKFPVSFQNTVQNSFHFLHSSGRLHWLTVIHAQLKHFHNCSSTHGCYLMHLRNRDQHSQTGGVPMSLSLSLRCQPTISTPSSTVPSVPWRFLSLSLSTPVPILPGKQQCFRLQSQGHQSVQTSVTPHCSCTLSNLRCSTTHVLSHKCGN